MRILIEENVHEAELGMLGGADVAILAYPDHLFALEQEEPYTHVYCRDQAAVDAVLQLLPGAQLNGRDPGQDHFIVYVPQAGHEVVSALYPLFTEDLPPFLPFQQMVEMELDEFLAAAQNGRGLSVVIMGVPASPGLSPSSRQLFEELIGDVLAELAGLGSQFEQALHEMSGYGSDYLSTLGYRPERPIHSANQVRRARQLRPGHFYRLVTGVAPQESELIQFLRIEKADGLRYMVYRHVEPYAGFPINHTFLADAGVEPYVDAGVRFWNTTNYVERVPAPRKFVLRLKGGKLVRCKADR